MIFACRLERRPRASGGRLFSFTDLAAVLLTFVAVTNGRAVAPIGGHQTNLIEGWTVLVSERLPKEDRAATANTGSIFFFMGSPIHNS